MLAARRKTKVPGAVSLPSADIQAAIHSTDPQTAQDDSHPAQLIDKLFEEGAAHVREHGMNADDSAMPRLENDGGSVKLDDL